MASWDGVAAIPCLIYSSEQEHVEFVGVHAVTPFDGASKSVWGNFFGEGAPPSGEHASWARSASGGTCSSARTSRSRAGTPSRTTCSWAGRRAAPSGLCPGAYLRRLADDDGELSYSRNYAQGAMWAAVAIYGRKCSGFSSFDDNVPWVVGRVSDPGRGLQPSTSELTELRWVDRGY